MLLMDPQCNVTPLVISIGRYMHIKHMFILSLKDFSLKNRVSECPVTDSLLYINVYSTVHFIIIISTACISFMQIKVIWQLTVTELIL